MWTAAEHASLTQHGKSGFIALLLLQLNASLHDTAETRQHGLLLPGVPGHQYFELLLHQIQALGVIPQAILQQDEINRGDGVAPAEEGAGL